MPIDQTKEFLPLNIAILTLSDSRTLENDISGQVLVDRLLEAGHTLADRAIIKDEKDEVSVFDTLFKIKRLDLYSNI